MKKPFTLIALGLLPLLLSSQIPQAFNYQAVVRDANGPIQNGTVDIKIDILQNGVSIYCEEHKNQPTGQWGIVNLKIGLGMQCSGGIFSDIDWSAGQFQLEVYLNGEPMGPAADIVAVPVALYAQNSGDSYWVKNGTDISYDEGKIGVGTNTPNFLLDVEAPGETGKTTMARFWRPGENTFLINEYGGSDNLVQLAVINAEQNLSLVTSSGNSLNETTSTGIYIKSGGNVGIGNINPLAKLHINEPDATLAGGGGLLLGDINGDNLVIDRNEIMARHDGGIGQLNLQNDGGDLRVHGGSFVVKDNGNVGIGTPNPGEKLDVRGTTKTRCLEITGGCDIKEDLNSLENLEPGDVVVIDENNPGNIRRTTEAYDKKAAGVISGANGINPGISLSQEDVLDGDYPLTMLGRVYVKVTGKVEVGDMLTTSPKPGFAMSARDYSKANGAVVGKAMTGNDGGEGMVLVLVNLQ
ncbi:MAG: hypothetical protein KDD10_05235 [Phaeodactylibacter sp.]|nr:hypothetical protein [Phaeodactylibacter sp.]MCB9293801.1 hypothetical protein [Lewinellaceae bacterium]